MNNFLPVKRPCFYFFSLKISLFLSLVCGSTCRCCEQKIKKNETIKQEIGKPKSFHIYSAYQKTAFFNLPNHIDEKDKKIFGNACYLFLNGAELQKSSELQKSFSNFFDLIKKEDLPKFISLIPFFAFDHKLLKLVLDALPGTKSLKTHLGRIFGDPYYLNILDPIKNFLIPCSKSAVNPMCSPNIAELTKELIGDKYKRIKRLFLSPKDGYRAAIEDLTYLVCDDNSKKSLTNAVYKTCHIWKRTEEKKWIPVFSKGMPTFSAICFDPTERACLITSLYDGSYYVPLTENTIVPSDNLCANSAERATFNGDGTEFALACSNHIIKIFDCSDNKKTLLKCEMSATLGAGLLGNEPIADFKFSPHEKDVLVIASEGGWIAGWNYKTGETYRFLACDDIMPCSPVKELSLLGPRHVLLGHCDGTCSEVFALSPATYLAYKILSEKNELRIKLKDLKKIDFAKSFSLFDLKEEANRELSTIKSLPRIKCKISPKWEITLALEKTI